MATGRESSIAIPPAPNWYGSALGDWGGADGTLYAYAARNAVVIVRPEETHGACRRFVGTLVGHTNRVTALGFGRQRGVAHLLVSGSADTNLRLWDTDSLRCLRVLRGHCTEVSALSISPIVPDLCVSGDRGGKCLVWRFGAATTNSGGGTGTGTGNDAKETQQRPIRALHSLDNSPVLTVAMSPNATAPNDVAIGHQSGALAVADVEASAPPKRLPARPAEVQCLVWLPVVHTMNAGSEDTNEDDTNEDGTQTQERTDERTDGATAASFGTRIVSNKHRRGVCVLAVGSRDKCVTLWTWDGERTSLRRTFVLPKCGGHVSEQQRGRLWVALAWCAGGEGDEIDGARTLDDTETENTADVARLVVASHGGELLCWDVSLDDDLFGVATGGERGGGELNPRTNCPGVSDFGNKPATQQAPGAFAGDGHSKTVFGISVSRRGVAVTISLDRTISCWNVKTRGKMWQVTGLGGFAYHGALDPEDPRRVAVACGDGSVRVLNLTEPDGGGGGGDDANVTCTALPSSTSGTNVSNSSVLWRGLPQTKATRLAWCPVDDFAASETNGDDAQGESFASLAVGLEDGRVVTVDAAGGGRHATQRDCHAGAVTGAQWVRVCSSGKRELITLGEGRLWRWVSLAAPEGRRKRGGGGGGAFVDVTMRFHDAASLGKASTDASAAAAVITSFAFLDIAPGDSGSDVSTADAFPSVAVGWSDGSVSAHVRDVSVPTHDFAFRTSWRVTEHSKPVSAVRWHPSAGFRDSTRHNWLASVAGDGSFLVWDGIAGSVAWSAPPSRRALLDVAWRPRLFASPRTQQDSDSDRDTSVDTADAIAVTTGADGIARAWNVGGAPVAYATMRGHEGRALFALWAGASFGRRNKGRPTASLVTGSDDQTVRSWTVDHETHSPAAEAAATWRAKQEKELRKLARERESTGAGSFPAEEKSASGAQGDDSACGEHDETRQDTASLHATAGSSNPTNVIFTSTTAGAGGGKKKRKGTGGRGIIKPPAWESTPDGIAAGRVAAVRLARMLSRQKSKSGVPSDVTDELIDDDASDDELIDDQSAGYGPHGLGLYLGQEAAMRLLRLEERFSGGGESEARADVCGNADNNAPNDPHVARRYQTSESTSASDHVSGHQAAFRPPERAAAAALFRGDFATAADTLFAAIDGPIPADFLAALVGGGLFLYKDAATKQADRLETKGEHQRAAILRLSLHDVRGAIASLRRGGLERDAAALAAARLLPHDPALVETRRALAAAEETRGGAEAAAKAHLASGRVSAAVRALTRPGQGGARAAAEIALVMGKYFPLPHFAD